MRSKRVRDCCAAPVDQSLLAGPFRGRVELLGIGR